MELNSISQAQKKLQTQKTKFLPWQAQQWERLQQQKQQGRLPHALLFSGAAGLGKEYFANAFMKEILCQRRSQCSPIADQVYSDIPEAKSEDTCKSCHLLLNNSHPDVALIVPEENKKAIKIEQIRRVIDFLNQTSQYGGYKIVMINPADQMNRAAANALLKTLEEPTKNSLLILISAIPSQLPATLRSRCQSIYFKTPTDELARAWLQQQTNQDYQQSLKLTQGAPLAALTLQESDLVKQSEELFADLNSLLQQQGAMIEIAKKWMSFDINILLDWVTIWVSEMITHSSRLKLFELLSLVYEMKRQTRQQFNINQTLMLETLFHHIDDLK